MTGATRVHGTVQNEGITAATSETTGERGRTSRSETFEITIENAAIETEAISRLETAPKDHSVQTATRNPNVASAPRTVTAALAAHLPISLEANLHKFSTRSYLTL